MSHPAIQAAVDGFRDAIGGYQLPENHAAADVDDFFESLPSLFEEFGDTVTGLAEKFRDDSPIERIVAEYLKEVAGGLTNMSEGAQETYTAWRQANAADIERVENPRPNEEAFNV